VFPDFLGIGAQKAGTTWLHENLGKQAGIWLPPVKELHFLDHEPASMRARLFGRTSHRRLARQYFFDTARSVVSGQASWSNLRSAYLLAYGRQSYEWYEALFPQMPGWICGEICPGYARMSVDRIRAIYQRGPRTKIIYLLRDPIDRAWSALAMHFRKDGVVVDVPKVEIERRFASARSRAHNEYTRNITAWTDVFPEKQIFFGFFEEIAEDPHRFLGRILDFLGVGGPIAATDPYSRVNAGRGEVMPLPVKRVLAAALLPEAEFLNARFSNDYTRRWLEHARRDAVREATG
jgi:hypothetical protein